MKKILIAVDLQKDFLLDSGKLNLGHDTTEYRKRVAKYIKNFEGLILVTMDHHRLNSCEFLANNPKGFPEHCVMGTEGEDLIPEIDNKKIDHYFWKHTFSSNELVRNLKSLYLENNEDSFELHFIGVCSHICVFANIAAIVNAFKEDNAFRFIPKIVVHKNLCDDFNPQLAEASFQMMKNLYCAEIVED